MLFLTCLLNRQPLCCSCSNQCVDFLCARAPPAPAPPETATIDGAQLLQPSINDLYYILTKLQGKLLAKETIRQLLLNFSVINVTEPVIVIAMNSQMSDLEDASGGGGGLALTELCCLEH